jgi:hypothetical protein
MTNDGQSELDPFADRTFNRFAPGSFLESSPARASDEPIDWRQRIDGLTKIVDDIRIRMVEEGLSVYGATPDGCENCFFDEVLRDDYRNLQRFYREECDLIDAALVRVAVMISFVSHGRRTKHDALKFLGDLEIAEV